MSYADLLVAEPRVYASIAAMLGLFVAFGWPRGRVTDGTRSSSRPHPKPSGTPTSSMCTRPTTGQPSLTPADVRVPEKPTRQLILNYAFISLEQSLRG